MSRKKRRGTASANKSGPPNDPNGSRSQTGPSDGSSNDADPTSESSNDIVTGSVPRSARTWISLAIFIYAIGLI
ncbi:MAG: hypothetical protein AAFP69_17675, partial [Planctomycetota bacterium]